MNPDPNRHEASRPAFEAHYPFGSSVTETTMKNIVWEAWCRALDWRAAQVCGWTHDEAHGKWDSDCGKAWQFMNGGPDDNNVQCCHGCGRRVKIQDSEQQTTPNQ